MGSRSWLRLSERIKPGENLDRFIPNRSAMDFGYANYMLTQRVTEKENRTPAEDAYLKLLAEALGVNRTRILAFKDKPREKVELIPHGFYPPVHEAKPPKPLKPARKRAQLKLVVPDLLDDWYLNLLDWGSNNILAIGLATSVFFWDSSNSTRSELVTFDDEIGPVTSVSWDDDGRYIAIGLNNSDVELWDSTTYQLVRTLRGCHQSLVSSLAWNNYILTTGGRDGKIINNDMRARSHIIGTYKGHTQEVCGMQWSPSGHQLASGGNDNMVYIWDRSMASSNSHSRWLHKLEDHTSTVKALAWCPFERNLLASGGGSNDQCIKFWSTHSGSCLNSVDTGSEVCSLLWNDKERELLSSHGSPRNQLTLWKYPSMEKTVEFTGHRSRVLYMAQVKFGILEAGAYGVSQSRKRAFIWAASLEETLPEWTEPMHVFAVPELKITLSENMQYAAVRSTAAGAPFGAITVRDSIGDLPAIKNGASMMNLEYKNDPVSWFQKKIRGDMVVLTDHISKEMNELNLIRCQKIPRRPRADWHSLPDEKVKLSTGQLVDLIPWCLPNTAKRQNQRNGLFGRLDWEGNFPNSITDPQPMGKVGMCFHPEQDRILSVRECARS